VIGHWRHVPKSKVPTIETRLYRTLDPRETRALEDAIERYGAFLGVTVSRIS
jgi:hypothetical protein